MSFIQNLPIVQRSASTAEPAAIPAGTTEVAKLIDVSKCIGCKACQVACLEWNEQTEDVGVNAGVYDNPHDLTEHSWTLMRFTEHVNADDNLEWLIRKDGCMHCADPGCLKACPAPGAIVQYANGIVDFVTENCIGCGYCVKGCPFDVPRLSQGTVRKAYKCTLCSDRVANGAGPACAKACPTKAITFGSKVDMVELAATRVADLNERGFQNAGLYNPEGVGGTHVMYVLHHADKPSLYSGLPDKPKIDETVALWKGMFKPFSLAAIGAAALFGLLHFVAMGPNRVSKDDEDNADRLAGGKS
jgi:formate dehydrogenase iron-sulfur subunit